MQRIASVIYLFALALLIGLQLWIISIDFEQMKIGKYTALSPIMYILYNIPSSILFFISQIINPNRIQILIYALAFLAMIAVYIFLTPESGYT
jgi:hypothetical protein